MIPNAMSELERWRAEAEALPSDEVRLPVPFHVMMGEAIDVAKFLERRRKASKGEGGDALPGLESAGEGKLPPALGDEIVSLQQAAQQAHTEYLLAVDPLAPGGDLGRARFVRNELVAALEWHFDDGVEDEHDAKLGALRDEHRDDPETADALAGELYDYATLATAVREQIDGVGGFDAALIDEAKQLARQLRERPTSAVGSTDAARRAIALRNRLLILLTRRVQLVRSAARFVYRHHPDVVREVTSAYERRRRAAGRRPAGQPGGGAGEGPAG